MSSISRGMVQFGGNTYRIIKRGTIHEIVRVLDDCPVGSFRRKPALELVECQIDREVALAIARKALHTGRLSYVPKGEESRALVAQWLDALRWSDTPGVALALGVAHRMLVA